MNLYPGDILLVNIPWGSLDWLVKWLVGEWDHCAIIYRTDPPPLIIEATPSQGVEISPLRLHSGREVVLLHPDALNWQGIAYQASLNAEKLASGPDAYNYIAIVRWVIPRLILAKFGIAYKHWRRSRWHECAELVDDAYYKVPYPLLEEDIVPLPDDLLHSLKLRVVWHGLVDELLN
jgi:hypothetical protein